MVPDIKFPAPRFSHWAVVLCALFLVPAWAHAQQEKARGAPTATRPALQVHQVDQAPDIDGSVDEAVWKQYFTTLDLIQIDPNEGEPATQKTEAAVLVKGKNLYVGALLYDTDPSKIVARLARRDQNVRADAFQITLDSQHDHLTATRFRVTAGGARFDSQIFSRGGEDASWDPVWESEVERTQQGWSLEMRIPLSQLSFSEGADTWGVQMRRIILRNREEAVLAFTPETQHRGISQYGHLEQFASVQSPARLEVSPYVSLEAEDGSTTPSAPGANTDTDFTPRAGGDVAYHLTSGLTLEATFNPDFGQAEVDAAKVNLSAFEESFPEKRQFFIQGADAFQFGELRSFGTTDFPDLYNSRRIGAQARHRTINQRVVNPPSEATIPAAIKLTGRTSNGWSLGFLNAVTLEEKAPTLTEAGPIEEQPVTPLTNHLVFRPEKEFNEGSTSIGLLGTAVHRDLSTPLLERSLHDQAYVGGLDLHHAWGNREWVIDGDVAVSHVRGSPEAILSTQTSSVRFFQRPDAESFEVDPTRESLTGHAFELSGARQTGDWRGSLTYQETSPEFEANDLGFQQRADNRSITGTLKWRETKPNAVLRQIEVLGLSGNKWNFDGDHIEQVWGGLVYGQFANWWPFSVQGLIRPETADPTLTRGGPLARSPASRTFVGDLNTDPRKNFNVGVNAVYQEDDAGAQTVQLGPRFTFQPDPSLSVELSPTYTDRQEVAQFVRNVADPTATHTFGTRHLFGDLDQEVLSLDTRVDWTFTSDLSAQLFVQPFVTTSQFSRFKEFTAPNTFAFDVYGQDKGTIGPGPAPGTYQIDPDGSGPADSFVVRDPGFEALSFRGNFVGRWEFGPGSTLFVIWQQERQGFRPGSDNVFEGSDIGDIFSQNVQNTFLLKASYWLDF